MITDKTAEEYDYLYCKIDDLEKETDMLRDCIKDLSTKLVKAKHTLKFYADEGNYNQQRVGVHFDGQGVEQCDDSECIPIFSDNGNLAEVTLREIDTM